MSNPDLTISIVSHNTRNLLRDCLSSVYDNIKDIKFEVIVVDNNSTDDSLEMVKKKFPQVTLVENKENVGFAKANNQVLNRGRGRFFLLLNSDTKVLTCRIGRNNTSQTNYEFSLRGKVYQWSDCVSDSNLDSGNNLHQVYL